MGKYSYLIHILKIEASILLIYVLILLKIGPPLRKSRGGIGPPWKNQGHSSTLRWKVCSTLGETVSFSHLGEGNLHWVWCVEITPKYVAPKRYRALSPGEGVGESVVISLYNICNVDYWEINNYTTQDVWIDCVNSYWNSV